MNSPFPSNQLPMPAERLRQRKRSTDPCKDYQRNCFRSRSGNGTSKAWSGQHLRSILMNFRVETSRCPIRKPEDQTGNVAMENERDVGRKDKKQDSKRRRESVETETHYL